MLKPKQEPPSIIIRTSKGRVEFHRDTRNQWRWRVVAKNGRILSTSSEGYVRRLDCLKAFELAFVISDFALYTLPLDIPTRYPVEFKERF